MLYFISWGKFKLAFYSIYWSGFLCWYLLDFAVPRWQQATVWDYFADAIERNPFCLETQLHQCPVVQLLISHCCISFAASTIGDRNFPWEITCWNCKHKHVHETILFAVCLVRKHWQLYEKPRCINHFLNVYFACQKEFTSMVVFSFVLWITLKSSFCYQSHHRLMDSLWSGSCRMFLLRTDSLLDHVSSFVLRRVHSLACSYPTTASFLRGKT